MSHTYGLSVKLSFVYILLYASFIYSDNYENLIYGNNFKKLAKFVVDEQYLEFNPEDVQQGDIIFVKNRAEFLRLFFLFINPKIENRYILITHNDDCPSSFAKKYLYLDKIFAWFSINVDLKDPKMIPIPIGIGQGCYGDYYAKQMCEFFLKPEETVKKYLLYMNFNVQTNPQKRIPVFKLFNDKNYCFTPKKCLFTPAIRKSPGEFLEDVRHSKFVLCPEGNGMDCYRTWEALYVHSIPILKSSPLDVLLENLPVLIVKDWSEINQAFLERKYQMIKRKNYNYEKLNFDYWKNLIYEYQNKCRRSQKLINSY